MEYPASDPRKPSVSGSSAGSGEPVMHCPGCGAANNASWLYCLECRRPLHPGRVVPRTDTPTGSRFNHWILPVNVAKLALWAGYVGLLAIVAYPAPLALLLGILAIRDLRRHPEKRGMGRAVFAIVMGSIGTVILLLLVVAPRLR